MTEHSKIQTWPTLARDAYFFPFYIVGLLNAPTWTNTQNKRHRRAMNRLNGAIVLGALNLIFALDAWEIAGRPFPLPGSGPALWAFAALFMLPPSFLLSADRGEAMLNAWRQNDRRISRWIGLISISIYGSACVYFFTAAVPKSKGSDVARSGHAVSANRCSSCRDE